MQSKADVRRSLPATYGHVSHCDDIARATYPNPKQTHTDKAYQRLRVPKGLELTMAGSLGTGFIPAPHRRKAESSIAWQNWFRRLSKDYEEKSQGSQEMIKWA